MIPSMQSATYEFVVAGQAGLHGLLERLRDLGIEPVSVDVVE